MRFLISTIVCSLVLCSCVSNNKVAIKHYALPQLNLQQAHNLAQLPMHCVETEYPNKLHQTLAGDEDLKTPKQLHPAFYGCFDWHSAVHGYWSMVSLLKQFPMLQDADKMKALLLKNITPENIAVEVAYFHGKYSKSWERTYGWAWLLKLAQELHNWNDPLAKELEANLQPLTDLIVQRYTDFLPKLHYQIRVGEHPNTAFGLSFAHEYAITVANHDFQTLIEQRALDFYASDEGCPINWEPGGFDFLSPCLQEMDIMRRVLPASQFKTWLDKFLPSLRKKSYDLNVGVVSDRSDGKLVHLDGVNFSRAWCLYGLGNQFPEYRHIINIANKHMQYSLPHVVGDSYEGGHWLATFVIYALNTSKVGP
ncbi:MAG TPA: DUF2891 domain-containing protein [Oceanospirillales bacterium]|nr:DUF2891 domain-containing protein [Oceanospirillales bacterium]